MKTGIRKVTGMYGVAVIGQSLVPVMYTGLATGRMGLAAITGFPADGVHLKAMVTVAVMDMDMVTAGNIDIEIYSGVQPKMQRLLPVGSLCLFYFILG